MSTELKPCPHCGGTASAYPRTCEKDTPYDPLDTAFPIVRCGLCFASSPGKNWSGERTAIDAWNTRTPDPMLEVMAEALINISEYWNRDQNETAMADALWHIIEVSEAALSQYESAKEKQG
jgi:hypothetical protein